MIFLLSFDSTHDALATQKALALYEPQVIPVPRAITAGCGMALRFEVEDVQAMHAITAQIPLTKDGYVLYSKEGEAYRRQER